ncbi:hypothetical protein MLD38_010828 [Melastoma candidum]|uniref:Uncharacterized protein n=1 Tax=Melastoma candidum TaxID=119954 RepID=A0ACB9R1N8_9MYRT|nr:hypothetical protein MLD38_010828 [Melastoma candidum]
MKMCFAVRVTVALLSLLVAFSVIGIHGQSICNVTIAGLEQCLPSVKPPNPTPPTVSCCNALQSANFPCLCNYKDSPIIIAMGINIDLAMKLPAQCSIPGTPSHC